MKTPEEEYRKSPRQFHGFFLNLSIREDINPDVSMIVAVSISRVIEYLSVMTSADTISH